jgi:hypothetical protein
MNLTPKRTGAPEELGRDVGDADLGERVAEGERREVQVPLVAGATVEVDRAQAAPGIGVRGHHAHGIPREPARPDVVDESSRVQVERKVDGAVLVRRVRRRDPVGDDRSPSVSLLIGGRDAKSSQNFSYDPS